MANRLFRRDGRCRSALYQRPHLPQCGHAERYVFPAACRRTVMADERSACSRIPDDGGVLSPEVAVFGDQVAEVLGRTLGTDLVGVYFVGSVALGGYVPGESDIDIAAVSNFALTDPQKRRVGSAVVEVSVAMPSPRLGVHSLPSRSRGLTSRRRRLRGERQWRTANAYGCALGRKGRAWLLVCVGPGHRAPLWSCDQRAARAKALC